MLAVVVYVTAKFVNSLSSLTKVLRLFQNGVGSSACCAGGMSDEFIFYCVACIGGGWS